MWTVRVLQVFPSLIRFLQKMKPFQYLTTVTVLAVLASHPAVAAPASGNQARSDSAAFSDPSDTIFISKVESNNNQIGIVSGDLSGQNIVISNHASTGPNGVTFKWTSPSGGGTVTETVTENSNASPSVNIVDT